ncbi:DUF6364 family protein [Algoriphagus aquimarinus]|uniref:Antitoxin n=1 Tax=Algoriphagus aquimarinus TaxID=237018 RepID=A0A1I0WKM5_9BACT|nr:DUF6364 family protein [Algoriphagus aquimarinus]SFA89299.1 hypothetical protein SAMN04489723_102194 [Algoriphagus aquimarinus]
MNKKLTLSLNEKVIKKAKLYAENTGNSLSGLVEDYFEKITSSYARHTISERLQAIAGKIELPPNFEDEEELRKAMEEKHLK